MAQITSEPKTEVKKIAFKTPRLQPFGVNLWTGESTEGYVPATRENRKSEKTCKVSDTKKR